MKGFIEFIRTQGVVGLAIGFILGSEASRVVGSLVYDIINPLLGLFLGVGGGLTTASIQIGSAQVMWGDFVSVLINFLVVVLVVYIVVKKLKLEKHIEKKE